MVEDENGGPWSFERRFMVTEVFLALLWVSFALGVAPQESRCDIACICKAGRPRRNVQLAGWR